MLQVRPEKIPVVVVPVPTSVPPRYRPYPVTPTLSVEADQVSAMLVAVRELATTSAGAVGACVSGQASVEPITDAFGDALPAASKASTSNVYAVPQRETRDRRGRCVVVDARDAVAVAAVARHRDVVGRGRVPRREALVRRCADRRLRRLARRRGRLRVGRGGGGGGGVVEQALVEVVSARARGAVAGGVEGLDREGVGGPAGRARTGSRPARSARPPSLPLRYRS